MMKSFRPARSRRDFCKGLSVSIGTLALPLSLYDQALDGQSQEDPIVRSNRSLSIGINRKTGKAFVEEKSTGEVWIWDWNDVRASVSASTPFPRYFLEEKESLSAYLKPIAPESIIPLSDGFQLCYALGRGRFNCSVQLSGQDADVLFRLEPDLRYPSDLSAIQFPSTLRSEAQPRPVFLDTLSGGRMHRPSISPTSFTLASDGCMMRYYAVMGSRSAYLAILEPAFDASLTYSDEGGGPLHFGYVHGLHQGSLDQVRTQRFRFVPGASHVAIARAYRTYAKQQGFYKSLREKLEECPSLEKMFGTVLVMLGYLHDFEADYAGAFRQLRKRGVERAYVYPVGHFDLNGSDELVPGYKWVNLSPEILHELQEIGYLYAPWVWMSGIREGSPYYQDPLLRHDPNGSKHLHWQIGELRWYDSHHGRALEILKEAASELSNKFSAIHFDVLTALPCQENFGSWPYDRKMDSEYRDAMFAQFSKRNRPVGSEQNRDWAIPFDHFGCDKLPGPYGKDAPFWPVPLWQLAFHDAVMTSWWEHSTYNDPGLGHDFSGGEIRRRMLLDTLTGDLPSVAPVGRMYGFTGTASEMFVFRYKIDDPVTLKAIDAAVEVSRFNALHATDDLVHHAFLSEDGLEQETEYASGTRVKIRIPDPQRAGDQGELKVS